MGKVIPLRPTEHEPSAKEALENIGEAFEKFCKAVEEMKVKTNDKGIHQ